MESIQIHREQNIQKTNRNTSIELFRIVLMLMIVSCHSTILCDENTIASDIPISNIILRCFQLRGGYIADECFFIISGYFMIFLSCNFRKILKLLLEVFTYAILAVLVYFIVRQFGLWNYTEVDNLSLIKSLATVLIPISSGTWWFISTYFALYLITPLLNPILTKFSSKGYLLFLFVGYVFLFVITDTFSGPYWMIEKAIVFYAIGGFIRRFIKNERINYIAFAIAIIVFITIGFVEYKRLHFEQNELISLILYGFQGALLMPLCAISLFVFFTSIKIPYNPIINKVASTTFGIYLLHRNFAFDGLFWGYFFKVSNLLQNKYYGLYILIPITLVFIICSIIELIRQFVLEDKLLNFILRIIQKIQKWSNNQ